MDALLLLLALGLLILLFPRIEFFIRLRGRAKADYLKARGTVHRKLLQNCLTELDRDISQLGGKVQQLTLRRISLEKERNRELEIALTSHIMEHELEKIPGIGPTLKERIIRSPYGASLENLSHTGPIKGVRNEKNTAVRRWARTMKTRIPKLLKEDFPGKTDILKKYTQLEGEVEKELNASNLRLRDLQHLRNEVSAALTGLKTVNISTFLDAYRGDIKAAETVTQYLTGVFPEWRSPPQWFKRLTDQYGAT